MNTSAEFLAMLQRGLYMDFGIFCCVYFFNKKCCLENPVEHYHNCVTVI